MIIGITGTLGAGKDTVAEYFEKINFTIHNSGDVVRKECTKRGVQLTLENLRDVSNDMRRKHGPNIIALVIIERIKALGEKNCVITGLRNPHEVEEFKKLGNFILIAIDAPIENRYERIQDRGREDDNINFEDFKAIEEKQKSGTEENVQQLNKVISMADYKIVNDTSKKDLNEKLDDLLDYLRNKENGK